MNLRERFIGFWKVDQEVEGQKVNGVLVFDPTLKIVCTMTPELPGGRPDAYYIYFSGVFDVDSEDSWHYNVINSNIYWPGIQRRHYKFSEDGSILTLWSPDFTKHVNWRRLSTPYRFP